MTSRPRRRVPDVFGNVDATAIRATSERRERLVHVRQSQTTQKVASGKRRETINVATIPGDRIDILKLAHDENQSGEINA